MGVDLRNSTGFSLIDMLLQEQQVLQTPAARFSEEHKRQHSAPEINRFKDLIPLSKPRPGEQYAFQVDLDKCTGCKACVTACHNLNGLDVREAWRDAGKIINPDNLSVSFQQTVTTACHHCQDPACMNGCPVMAYEKDPLTGIVRHLDDQCIGCQYCVLKCPYDVPKFNKKLGIVRKCDMCHNRLEVGEAPACVQACPNEAITIVNISAEEIHLQSEKAFLPGSPEPGYTKPSTKYTSKKIIPSGSIAADQYSLKIQDAHLPLVFMLILTQMSVGFYTLGYLLKNFFSDEAYLLHLSAINLILTVIGIGFSTLHLGKPLKAWKAFLGVRKSWMSREVLAFAGVMQFSAILTAFYVLPHLPIPDFLFNVLHITLLITGLSAIFASVKLYDDTRRRRWRLGVTGFKFGTTLLGLGAQSIIVYSLFSNQPLLTQQLIVLTIVVIITFCFKLANEHTFLKNTESFGFSIDKKSAMLIKKKLRVFAGIRFYTAIAGILLTAFAGFSAIYISVSGYSTAIIGSLALLCFFGSELNERYLFFTSVDAPKMPGEFE